MWSPNITWSHFCEVAKAGLGGMHPLPEHLGSWGIWTIKSSRPSGLDIEFQASLDGGGSTCLYSQHWGDRSRPLSMSLRLAWTTEIVPEQQELHKETFSLEKKSNRSSKIKRSKLQDNSRVRLLGEGAENGKMSSNDTKNSLSGGFLNNTGPWLKMWGYVL